VTESLTAYSLIKGDNFRPKCVASKLESGEESPLECNDFLNDKSKCLKSKSQSGEEDTVRAAFGFGDKMGGTYVEIGGLDGELFSNTASLATCQRWSGIMVEGSPINYGKLKTNVVAQKRSRVVAWNGAVCPPPIPHVEFIEFGAVGGDLGAMSEGFKKEWHPDGRQSVKVSCKPMSFYLTGVKHVDFFSLDVEGAELMVLETMDFTKITIDVMIIETDQHAPEKNWLVQTFMRNVGMPECTAHPVERSMLFVRKEFGVRYGC